MQFRSFVPLILMLLIMGCSSSDNNSSIDKEYMIKTAKIGITDTEITEQYGEDYFEEYVDGVDVWLFSKTKSDFSYNPDLNRVEYDEIKKGNIEYQLFVLLKDKKAFMYSYFYKNGEIWQYVLNPDGTRLESQVSH